MKDTVYNPTSIPNFGVLIGIMFLGLDQLTLDEREDTLLLRTSWTTVVNRISIQLPIKMSERFIQTMSPVSFVKDTLVVEVPSSFNAEWLRKRCLSEFQKELSKEMGKPILLDLRLKIQERNSDNSSSQAVKVAPLSADLSRFVPSKKFQFDTFVNGPSNRLALAGARAVAAEPGQKFNPLFIYGPSGLGKTHLMHAIAREVMLRDPRYPVTYITAQQFAEELIGSLHSGKIEQFRRSQRGCGVWLVDDIQFIAGKDRTQEEIFYTFNVLQQMGKQIVLCSDRPPRDLLLMDERLRSRLESGLLADIHPPDTETKSAILMSKAQQEGIKLPFEVALYLAENVSGNVRVLEGALTKVAAHSSLMALPLDLDLAKEIVDGHYAVATNLRPSIPQIISEVGKYYRIPTDDIKGPSRKAPVVQARHVAAYLAREVTGDSWQHIGAYLGGRDHSSIIHGHQKISEMISRDRELNQVVKSLKRNMNWNE